MNYMLRKEATIVLSIFGLIKKATIYMSEYFPELKSFGGRVKIDLDLSNYASKIDFKNETDFDASKFAKKVDLARAD